MEITFIDEMRRCLDASVSRLNYLSVLGPFCALGAKATNAEIVRSEKEGELTGEHGSYAIAAMLNVWDFWEGAQPPLRPTITLSGKALPLQVGIHLNREICYLLAAAFEEYTQFVGVVAALLHKRVPGFWHKDRPKALQIDLIEVGEIERFRNLNAPLRHRIRWKEILNSLEREHGVGGLLYENHENWPHACLRDWLRIVALLRHYITHCSRRVYWPDFCRRVGKETGLCGAQLESLCKYLLRFFHGDGDVKDLYLVDPKSVLNAPPTSDLFGNFFFFLELLASHEVLLSNRVAAYLSRVS